MAWGDVTQPPVPEGTREIFLGPEKVRFLVTSAAEEKLLREIHDPPKPSVKKAAKATRTPKPKKKAPTNKKK